MARSMSDAELRHRQKIQGRIAGPPRPWAWADWGCSVPDGPEEHGRGQGHPEDAEAEQDPCREARRSRDQHRDRLRGSAAWVGSTRRASTPQSRNDGSRGHRRRSHKGLTMDMGYFGEEGHALTTEEIEKAWTPVSSRFDSESAAGSAPARTRAGPSGRAGGHHIAGIHAGKAVQEGRNIKRVPPRRQSSRRPARRSPARRRDSRSTTAQVRHGKPFKAMRRRTRWCAPQARRKGRARAGCGRCRRWGPAIHQKRKGSWQPYAKRDTTSAFGVDHDPNGQHRETEN